MYTVHSSDPATLTSDPGELSRGRAAPRRYPTRSGAAHLSTSCMEARLPSPQLLSCPYDPDLMELIITTGEGGLLRLRNTVFRVERCGDPWSLQISPLPAVPREPQATATEKDHLPPGIEEPDPL